MIIKFDAHHSCQISVQSPGSPRTEVSRHCRCTESVNCFWSKHWSPWTRGAARGRWRPRQRCIKNDNSAINHRRDNPRRRAAASAHAPRPPARLMGGSLSTRAQLCCFAARFESYATLRNFVTVSTNLIINYAFSFFSRSFNNWLKFCIVM